jgi:hypothetical protein
VSEFRKSHVTLRRELRGLTGGFDLHPTQAPNKVRGEGDRERLRGREGERERGSSLTSPVLVRARVCNSPQATATTHVAQELGHHLVGIQEELGRSERVERRAKGMREGRGRTFSYLSSSRESKGMQISTGESNQVIPTTWHKLGHRLIGVQGNHHWLPNLLFLGNLWTESKSPVLVLAESVQCPVSCDEDTAET